VACSVVAVEGFLANASRPCHLASETFIDPRHPYSLQIIRSFTKMRKCLHTRAAIFRNYCKFTSMSQINILLTNCASKTCLSCLLHRIGVEISWNLRKGMASHVCYNCPLLSPRIQPYFSTPEATSFIHQSLNFGGLIMANLECNNSVWFEDVVIGD